MEQAKLDRLISHCQGECTANHQGKRGFGFHLPAGLLIKLGGAERLNLVLRHGICSKWERPTTRKSEGAGKIDGRIERTREERRNWPIA
jgi:hypothetical protein